MRPDPFWLLLFATPAGAQLSPRDLARAVARPPADARLPAALRFVDDANRSITLGEVAGGQPLALLFADYTCPHVCGPGLVLTSRALRESGAAEYRFAVIGLDPRDTLADARRFANGTAPRPVLLHGDETTVRQAADALGYGFVRDDGAGQYAHDASLYVFGADGRMTALLPELALRPRMLRAALSGNASPGRWTDQVARLCYGLAAAHGRWGRLAVTALQVVSIALVAGIALLLWRRRRAS